MFNSPLIRDTLIIDATVQGFYDQSDGTDPVYLLGRVVRHAPNFVLSIGVRPLVIVADTYDLNGGGIDGSGALKRGNAPVTTGGNGVDGVNAKLRKIGTQWRPVSAGTAGTAGGDSSSGYAGTDVTIYCHSATGVRIDVSATVSAPGGNGGNGGNGGDGAPDITYANGETVEGYYGTRGGKGGRGGDGGNGASGGAVTVYSTAPIPNPNLRTGGTAGSSGGRGGRWGRDGSNLPDVDGEPAESSSGIRAPDGAHGVDGISPPVVVQVLTEDDYRARMIAQLSSDPYGRRFANYWAPFRISVGEYYFRRFQPDDDNNLNGRLAAREFSAALEMQGDNAEASRLLKLLQSGSNALGVPRNQDVVPDFTRYTTSYNSITTLVTAFFNQGIAQILAAGQLDALANLLKVQEQVARDAVATVTTDLVQVQDEQKSQADQVTYLQQQLDETTAEIQQAMEAMKSQSFSIAEFFGVVAEVGAAIASVAAAIPTAGASLVALVPAVATLTSTVIDKAPFITKALLAGNKPDIDDVTKAYEKVGKNVDAVIAAGKTVVNFVHLIEKIAAGSTPENAESVALVKRGAELTHQVLVAKNQIDLSQQKLNATQARLGRVQGILNYIESQPPIDAASIRTAGQVTISAAMLQVDTLLHFAFLAQRSFEIYTLPSGTQLTPMLAAGSPDPDALRAYQDGLPNTEGPMVQAYQTAWNTLLQPIGLQRAYSDYLQRGIQTDVLRLKFTEAENPTSMAQFRRTGILPFRVELDDISQGCKETKIRGVAVALLGAVSNSSIVSCGVWHGTRYDQVGPEAAKAPGFPNGKPVSLLLDAKTKNLSASTTPLALAPVHFGDDEPIDAPQQLAYWGRGVGGDWELRLPPRQPGGEAINLNALDTVQVWIGYQYVPTA